MYIREDYIANTCAVDYKDLDGKILPKINNIDKTCDGDILCGEDKSVLDIFDEEIEYSWGILSDIPYGLITYRCI